MKYLYFVREKEIHGREDEIFGGNICNIYVSAESLKEENRRAMSFCIQCRFCAKKWEIHSNLDENEKFINGEPGI